MAYVGCIAGAILIEDYRRQLTEAGFAAVEVIDTGADLNAYAKVENQGGCCSPPTSRACRWSRRVAARRSQPTTTCTGACSTCCAGTT